MLSGSDPQQPCDTRTRERTRKHAFRTTRSEHTRDVPISHLTQHSGQKTRSCQQLPTILLCVLVRGICVYTTHMGKERLSQVQSGLLRCR